MKINPFSWCDVKEQDAELKQFENPEVKWCPLCGAAVNVKTPQAHVNCKKYTERGFRIFGKGLNYNQLYGPVSVGESSIAFAGAHCWVRQAVPKTDTRTDQAIHVGVKGAEWLIGALQEFVAEAKARNLVEPDSYGWEDEEDYPKGGW